ncbi:MAG: SRPBCC domain-containing protein [Pseudorhodoplanes sp.]|nr:SRPBCC domain-containing protein [Pseudorhodoplanes sp.]
MSASPKPIEKPAIKPSLTIKRRLNAPPAKVYAAWTDPAQLARWFGPADTVPGSVKAELDVRVGGRFRASFTGCMDGNNEYHEVGGVYREVVPNQKLVFTWAWHSTPERESLVTITIKPDGAGSLLTLHHEQFFDQAARDGHQRGWGGSLDKLEALFN